jgi:hypothetical protein
MAEERRKKKRQFEMYVQGKERVSISLQCQGMKYVR